MGKDIARLQNKGKAATRQRSSLSAMLTLSLWRLRQTWWLLLMIGVSLLAAFAIACIAPLFSQLAANAGLQGLFNGSSTRTTMTLTADSSTLATSVVQQDYQKLNGIVRSGFGVYLDPPVSQVITVQQMVITQPATLDHVNPLAIYATSITRLKPSLKLVAGNWASETMTNGFIEFMLPATTASALKLTPGATLTLQGGFLTPNSPHTSEQIDPRAVLHVRLAGIFADPSTNVPALFGETFQPIKDFTGVNYTLLMPDTAFLQAVDSFAASEQSTAISASRPDNDFHLNWFYHLHTGQLSFAQIPDLTGRLSNVQYIISSQAQDAQFTNLASGSGDILVLLQQYTSRIAVVNLPVTLLALQIIALLLFFACLLVNLLVDRQMNMSAQLSSRGASRRQLFWSLVAQGVGLTILALLLGPFLGWQAVFALAQRVLPADEQMSLNLTFASHSQIFVLIAPYLGSTFLLALLAVCLPFRGTNNMNILEVRRESARATHQPFWLRYYLDVLVALLALSGFGVTLYLANVARPLDIGSQELIIAPLALVAPLFLLLGCLLLFLRIFPLLLRLAVRFAQPARGATGMLALAQMARAPRQVMRLTMLLTLAVAFAFFSLAFTASQNQRAIDVSAYESGADFAGNLPITMQFRPHDDVTYPYSHIPGVLAASTGYVDHGTTPGLNDDSLPIELRAVDTGSFASSAIWGPQDSTLPLTSLMHLLSQQGPVKSNTLIVPAIVDETTLSSLHIHQGETFDVLLDQLGGIGISFQIIDVVEHIPTVNGSAGVNSDLSPSGVLVDYQTLNTIYKNIQFRDLGVPQEFTSPVPLNYVWLHTSDDPDKLASVRSALNSSSLALSNMYDRRDIISELQSDPLSSNILLILGIGGIAAFSLAFLGNLIASWLNVRLRLNSFVVLRALGATRRQIVLMLLWEQGIIYLSAFVLSLALGAVFTWLVVPSLVFTGLPSQGGLSELNATQFYLLQRILPPQVVMLSALQLTSVGLFLACALALLLMARTVLRPSFGQELRLNED